MNKRSLVTPRNQCTGCTACLHRCPTKAISMQADAEGFLYPSVDRQLCIECDLCNKVCPVGVDQERPSALKALSAYACWNKNSEELELSSSGGVFSLFAREIFARGGVVYGVVYDEQMDIYHHIARTPKDLERMRGSKYVQSDLRDSYPQIKQYLKQGIPVLFTGTPCQIHGLQSYLGKSKDHAELFCIELICEGTPSPGLFKSYIMEQCPDFEKATHFSLRDKRYGWTQAFLLDYQTKGNQQKRFLKKGMDDPYIAAMFGAISLRPACYSCPSREGRSGADITIGDLWALGIVAPSTRPPSGASSVLIYTSKGEKLYASIVANLAFEKKISAHSCAINNGFIYRSPALNEPLRSQFFNNYQQGIPLEKNLQDVQPLYRRVAILNHAGHSNYGSNLTAYALQEHLRRLGYFVRTVSLRPYRESDEAVIQPYNSFINCALLFSQDVYGAHDCTQLNEQFDTFIAGSDQIWRFSPSYKRQTAGASFLLDFTAADKRRIAYAGSFGLDTCTAPPERKRRMYHALHDLDAISTREQQGLRCLKEEFDIDHAQLVLDPVFLLTKYDWQRFSEAATSEYPNNILSYCSFYYDDVLPPLLNKIAEKQHLTLYHLKQIEVMDWLRIIEQSRLMVTDSFHALAFALIYECDFVALGSASNAMSRLTSVLNILGLTDRFIDLDKIATEDIEKHILEIAQEPINYEAIRATIATMREQSTVWLNNALSCEIKIKKHVLNYDPILASQEREPLRNIERAQIKQCFKRMVKALGRLHISTARYQFYLLRKSWKALRSF